MTTIIQPGAGMKFYRYWARPDGVVRHYDANTPEAAEDSARMILTLMPWDGWTKKVTADLEARGFVWGNKAYDRYSAMTFKQIQKISDADERDLAMAVYEAGLYHMVGEEMMNRIGVNNFPTSSMVHVRKDEVSTVEWAAVVLNATEYQLKTVDTGVLYRRVTFIEILEAVGGPWTLVTLDNLSVSDSEARATAPKFGLELTW